MLGTYIFVFKIFFKKSTIFFCRNNISIDLEGSTMCFILRHDPIAPICKNQKEDKEMPSLTAEADSGPLDKSE